MTNSRLTLIKMKGYHLLPDLESEQEGMYMFGAGATTLTIPLDMLEAVEQFPFLTIPVPEFIYDSFNGNPVIHYGGGLYFMVTMDYDKFVLELEGKSLNYN